MKHCFMILLVCALFCACTSSSSSAKKDDGYYSYKENGVLEEEFDLLLAPQMDYEEEIPYEEQMKASKQLTGKESVKLAKPQKKPAAKKVN